VDGAYRARRVVRRTAGVVNVRYVIRNTLT
jgi:hypothetical protein